MMNKIFFTLKFVACALFFIACGEDYLINESEMKSLKQYIYVLPDRYNGAPYEYGQPLSTVYLSQNETVKIQAAYTLNDKFISEEESEDLFKNHFWYIEGKTFNIANVRLTFSEIGAQKIILETVDLLEDTLRDTVNVFVNSPVNIALTYPENKYNLVDPYDNEGVYLEWETSGIDAWEEPLCEVFVSIEKDRVWKNKMGESSCRGGGYLQGPLFGNFKIDSSITFYWGIVARNSAAGGFLEIDTSEIFEFSTLLSRQEALLDISFAYDNMPVNSTSATRIVLENAFNDTLYDKIFHTLDTNFSLSILPQTGLRLTLTDLRKKDYEVLEHTFDASAPAKYTLEKFHFIDKTAPQIEPLQNLFNINEPIRFLALDNGTGIKENSIYAVMAGDTIQASFQENIITFENVCKNYPCDFTVHLVDNAYNRNQLLYWNLDYLRTNRIELKGPYLSQFRGDFE